MARGSYTVNKASSHTGDDDTSFRSCVRVLLIFSAIFWLIILYCSFIHPLSVYYLSVQEQVAEGESGEIGETQTEINGNRDIGSGDDYDDLYDNEDDEYLDGYSGETNRRTSFGTTKDRLSPEKILEHNTITGEIGLTTSIVIESAKEKVTAPRDEYSERVSFIPDTTEYFLENAETTKTPAETTRSPIAVPTVITLLMSAGTQSSEVELKKSETTNNTISTVQSVTPDEKNTNGGSPEFFFTESNTTHFTSHDTTNVTQPNIQLNSEPHLEATEHFDSDSEPTVIINDARYFLYSRGPATAAIPQATNGKITVTSGGYSGSVRPDTTELFLENVDATNIMEETTRGETARPSRTTLVMSPSSESFGAEFKKLEVTSDKISIFQDDAPHEESTYGGSTVFLFGDSNTSGFTSSDATELKRPYVQAASLGSNSETHLETTEHFDLYSEPTVIINDARYFLYSRGPPSATIPQATNRKITVSSDGYSGSVSGSPGTTELFLENADAKNIMEGTTRGETARPFGATLVMARSTETFGAEFEKDFTFSQLTRKKTEETPIKSQPSTVVDSTDSEVKTETKDEEFVDFRGVKFDPTIELRSTTDSEILTLMDNEKYETEDIFLHASIATVARAQENSVPSAAETDSATFIPEETGYVSSSLGHSSTHHRPSFKHNSETIKTSDLDITERTRFFPPILKVSTSTHEPWKETVFHRRQENDENASSPEKPYSIQSNFADAETAQLVNSVTTEIITHQQVTAEEMNEGQGFSESYSTYFEPTNYPTRDNIGPVKPTGISSTTKFYGVGSKANENISDGPKDKMFDLDHVSRTDSIDSSPSYHFPVENSTTADLLDSATNLNSTAVPIATTEQDSTNTDRSRVRHEITSMKSDDVQSSTLSRSPSKYFDEVSESTTAIHDGIKGNVTDHDGNTTSKTTNFQANTEFRNR